MGDMSWRFAHSPLLRFTTLFDPKQWPPSTAFRTPPHECDYCGAPLIITLTASSTFARECPNGCDRE